MNIHEHQAKQILKKYGAKVPKGVFALDVDELIEKAKALKTEKYVLKAQIHAGGRGKAGGVKLVKDLKQLKDEARKMMGKILCYIYRRASQRKKISERLIHLNHRACIQ